MNRVVLVGRLVKDPEIQYGKTNNKAFLRFCIAVDNTYGGEKKADFFDITAFEKKAELIARYCEKGDPILIEGRLTKDKFTDKNGYERSETKIMLNDFEFLKPIERKEGEKKEGETKGRSAAPWEKKEGGFMELPKDPDFGLPFN